MKLDEHMIKVVKKAMNGDESAFSSLYKKYYKKMYYYALKITHNEADASDALQDAFMQIHSSIKELRSPEYFLTWACRIVFTKCTKIFARNKDVFLDPDTIKKMSPHDDRRDNSPDIDYRFKDDQQVLQYLISSLRPNYQEILTLLYFMQFSIKEISYILNIPEGTVKSRTKLARDALKKKIDEFEMKENRKLDFKSASFGVMVASALSAECAVLSIKIPSMVMGSGFLLKLRHFIQTSPIQTAAVTMSATVFIASAGYIVQNPTSPTNQQIQIKQPPLVRNSISITAEKEFPKVTYNNIQTGVKEVQDAKDAYYILRNWAYNENQLQRKSKEEIKEMYPVYDALKSFQGTYWEMLQHGDWAQNYENMMNNN